MAMNKSVNVNMPVYKAGRGSANRFLVEDSDKADKTDKAVDHVFETADMCGVTLPHLLKGLKLKAPELFTTMVGAAPANVSANAEPLTDPSVVQQMLVDQLTSACNITFKDKLGGEPLLMSSESGYQTVFFDVDGCNSTALSAATRVTQPPSSKAAGPYYTFGGDSFVSYYRKLVGGMAYYFSDADKATLKLDRQQRLQDGANTIIPLYVAARKLDGGPAFPADLPADTDTRLNYIAMYIEQTWNGVIPSYLHEFKTAYDTFTGKYHTSSQINREQARMQALINTVEDNLDKPTAANGGLKDGLKGTYVVPWIPTSQDDIQSALDPDLNKSAITCAVHIEKESGNQVKISINGKGEYHTSAFLGLFSATVSNQTSYDYFSNSELTQSMDVSIAYKQATVVSMTPVQEAQGKGWYSELLLVDACANAQQDPNKTDVSGVHFIDPKSVKNVGPGSTCNYLKSAVICGEVSIDVTFKSSTLSELATKFSSTTSGGIKLFGFSLGGSGSYESKVTKRDETAQELTVSFTTKSITPGRGHTATLIAGVPAYPGDVKNLVRALATHPNSYAAPTSATMTTFAASSNGGPMVCSHHDGNVYDMGGWTVRNALNTTGDPNLTDRTSWIGGWRLHTGVMNPTCAAVNCLNAGTNGAHVVCPVNVRPLTIYIVPLCNGCNNVHNVAPFQLKAGTQGLHITDPSGAWA